MLVQDLVELLRRWDEDESLSSQQKDAVKQIVTILAPHRDMELETLFDLLRKAFKPKRQARSAGPHADGVPSASRQTAAEFTLALRESFQDDAAFRRLVESAKSSRGLTITVLKKAFAEVFGRSGNFRSKATKDEVLRKILDERNIKVRDDKMGQMLGRKPVAAE